MKSEADIRLILANITLTFQPWVIALRRDHQPMEVKDARLYLQIQDPYGACNITGKPMPWHGRKWMLSPWMTDSEIVATAFKAYMVAVEHEAREGFKYRGVTVYDPHIKIDDLVELRRARPLDGRKESDHA